MQWQQRLRRLIGKPVGISLINGGGTSGVLCGVQGNTLYVIEFMYQDQFALKQYNFNAVRDVNPFPPCRRIPNPGPNPGPGPGPRPPLY